jgi:hypothetical protein
MSTSPMMKNTSATGRAATSVLPQRKAPVLQAAPQRLPFRVLQTAHAPAQLSLFLRPASR